MSALPPELQEVVDRQKIYDVLTRYCRALDRCDVELMKSVYWEDAVDAHGIFHGNAHEFCEFIVKGVQEWFEVATRLSIVPNSRFAAMKRPCSTRPFSRAART